MSQGIDLVTLFLAATPSGSGALPPAGGDALPANARDHLERALREAVARARAAHPELALSDEDFVRHLGRHAGPGGAPADLAVAVAELNAPDLFLACACVHRVPGAVEEFERRYLARLSAFLAPLRPSPAFVDEVRQILSEKLLVSAPGSEPKLAEYAARGALLNWVRITAVRMALHLRGQRDERPHEDENVADRVLARVDPELDYIKERYRPEFQRAFADALAALSAEQRNLLRLNLVDGLNIEKIGGLLHVHRATVARRIAAAREEILDGARRLLRERLDLGTAEFDSLARVVHSQLDISLGAALRSRP